MADQEQLKILEQEHGSRRGSQGGRRQLQLAQEVAAWNEWRRQHSGMRPDLREANLSWADLRGANLVGADLRGANLWRADLNEADLSFADLSKANLREADLSEAWLVQACLVEAELWEADLSSAKLWEADLGRADLTEANLSGANLSKANLKGARMPRAILVDTILTSANITDCSIYGISAWNLQLHGTTQMNLIITPAREPIITVDNLEVAQFIYLLLKNERLREVIDTITSKAVLILGRFTPGRKAVLDGLREALRSRGYLPILFDFEKPASRDLTETISTLAHLARFIIADLTDAKSIPQELSVIVPNLPGVPIQPLLLGGSDEYPMFEHFKRYPWVLPIYRYDHQDALLANLEAKVIMPAMAKANELAPRAGAP
jgi:uncharacterized protein YjbI with pentapeptide repeats